MNGRFPAYHYELLNDIHASKAARKVVGSHHFTKPELDEISFRVGDFSTHNIPATHFTPCWDREAQPKLVADTLLLMATAFPYRDDE